MEIKGKGWKLLEVDSIPSNGRKRVQCPTCLSENLDRRYMPIGNKTYICYKCNSCDNYFTTNKSISKKDYVELINRNKRLEEQSNRQRRRNETATKLIELIGKIKTSPEIIEKIKRRLLDDEKI